MGKTNFGSLNAMAIAIKIGNLKRDVYDKVLPPLTEKQKNDLREKLQKEGFDIAQGFVLAVEEAGSIVVTDGHNRCEQAEKIGFHEVPVVVKPKAWYGNDIPKWIKRNALGQRNLSDHDQKILVSELLGDKRQNDANTMQGKTAAILAEELGIGTRTVERAVEYKKGVDEVSKELGEDKVRQGIVEKNAVTAGELQAVGKEKDVEKKKEMTDKIVEKIKIATDFLTIGHGKARKHMFMSMSDAKTLKGNSARDIGGKLPSEELGERLKVEMVGKFPITAEGLKAAEEYINNAIAAYGTEKVEKTVLDVPVQTVEVKEVEEVKTAPTTKREKIEQKLKEINAKEEEKVLEIIEGEIEKVAGAIRTPVFSAFLNKAVKAKLKEFGDTLDNVNDTERTEFVNAWNVIKKFIDRGGNAQ